MRVRGRPGLGHDPHRAQPLDGLRALVRAQQVPELRQDLVLEDRDPLHARAAAPSRRSRGAPPGSAVILASSCSRLSWRSCTAPSACARSWLSVAAVPSPSGAAQRADELLARGLVGLDLRLRVEAQRREAREELLRPLFPAFHPPRLARRPGRSRRPAGACGRRARSPRRSACPPALGGMLRAKSLWRSWKARRVEASV